MYCLASYCEPALRVQLQLQSVLLPMIVMYYTISSTESYVLYAPVVLVMALQVACASRSSQPRSQIAK